MYRYVLIYCSTVFFDIDAVAVMVTNYKFDGAVFDSKNIYNLL